MRYIKIAGTVAALLAMGALAACTDEAVNCPANNPSSGAGESAAASAPAPGETAAAAAPAATAAAAAPGATAAPAASAGASATPGTKTAAEAAAKPGAKPAAAAAAAPAATSGTISGTVTATPAKLGHHVVVYLANAPAAAPKKNVEIDQRNMRFLPYLTVVPVGTKVIFRNSDPFPHNVFSPDGEKFNLGLMPSHAARIHVFKRVGNYTLLCNIHPGMIGYVKVVPSPYFAKANKDGQFAIKNVPNGTYQIRAWAPKLAESEQSVTVKGATVNVQMHLHRGG